MPRYLIKRTLSVVPVLLGVSVIVFFSVRLAPGDPVRQVMGSHAGQERVEEVRHELGLDKPIVIQYGIWIRNALRGDMGTSIASHAPALKLVGERIGRTLQLTITALIITLLVSFTAGIISAVRQYKIADSLVTFGALFWLSMPVFWLGMMLMFLVAIRIPWLPISGSGEGYWSWDALRHLILPALTLGLPQAGTFTRLTRTSMLEVLRQDYITTARSKGIPEWKVIVKHAFRNALIPIVTMIGLQLPWLFGGSVIVETVFAWPGMGSMLTSAVFGRDYPLIQAIAMIYTVVVIGANYISDIAYVLIDPRIELR